MYKARVTKWGLDKNGKEKEMRALVRKDKGRRDLGKSSSFYVRGKVVQHKDVLRYWARKRTTIEDVIARRRSSATPEAVRCVTPVPSPVTPPRVFAIPERIFLCVKAYYQGSFESGTWIRPIEPSDTCFSVRTPLDVLPDLRSFFYHSLLACDLFTKQEFEEARRTLSLATSRLKRILLADVQETITQLFLLIIEVHRKGRPEIAHTILRHATAQGKKILGTDHPITQTCIWLGLVERSQLDDVVAAAVQGIQDYLKSELGPLAGSTLEARTNYITSFVGDRDYEQEGIALRSLLQECEINLHADDPRIFRTQLALGYHHLKRKDCRAALQVCQHINDHASGAPVQSTLEAMDHRCQYLYMSAFCWHALQEIDLAEKNMRTLIDLRLSIYGLHDGWAIGILSVLEHWLGEWGQLESAAQTRDRRRRLLEYHVMDERADLYTYSIQDDFHGTLSGC